MWRQRLSRNTGINTRIGGGRSLRRTKEPHISDPQSENTKRKGVSQLELDGELKALLTPK